jgi:hypothetical protein
MVYLIWEMHQKNYSIGKRLKMKKMIFFFSLTFVFGIKDH